MGRQQIPTQSLLERRFLTAPKRRGLTASYFPRGEESEWVRKIPLQCLPCLYQGNKIESKSLYSGVCGKEWMSRVSRLSKDWLA